MAEYLPKFREVSLNLSELISYIPCKKISTSFTYYKDFLRTRVSYTSWLSAQQTTGDH